MTVKRFLGATARDCLRRAKEEFGPDAVVISNRAVENGVEIVAMSPESLDAISRQGHAAGVAQTSRSSSPPVQPPPEESDYTVTLSAARRAASLAAMVEQHAVLARAPRENVDAGATRRPPVDYRDAAERPRPAPGSALHGPAGIPAPAASSSPAASEVQPRTAQLMDEMRIIKNLLERQLAGFAWGEMARAAPARALLLGEMLAAGFSGSLARRLVQEMAADLSKEDGRKLLTAAVNRRLRTLPSEDDFIDHGGVYALVGPTGVGKTTTAAKLAARCVVRYGAERLALVTTDGYRIGAHEQLRIYGRILGVPVFVVRDGEDLRRTLADLRDKHMVLIDTVGMSQRDRMVAEQAAMLTGSGEVNRLLLLNAGSRGDTLDDVVRAYGGVDLAGCILTKVDEATALAPALDCIVRHGLTLSYVANGQRVPEDLHLPNRKYLLHRAFKVGAGETAHSLRKEEVALTFAPSQVAPRKVSVA